MADDSKGSMSSLHSSLQRLADMQRNLKLTAGGSRPSSVSPTRGVHANGHSPALRSHPLSQMSSPERGPLPAPKAPGGSIASELREISSAIRSDPLKSFDLGLGHGTASAVLHGTRVFEQGSHQTLSPNGTPHNSKAVVAALKSLQDKIKSLDEERADFAEKYRRAQSEIEETKSTADQQVASTARNFEDREALLMEENRLLRSRIDHLQTEATKSKEQVTTMERELGYVKTIAQNKDAEKRALEEKVAHLERALEDMRGGQTIKVDALDDALKSCRARLEEVTTDRDKRVKDLEERLAEASNKARVAEETCQQYEENLSSVMELNEMLVEKVAKKVTTKKKVKKTKTPTPGSQVRASSFIRAQFSGSRNRASSTDAVRATSAGGFDLEAKPAKGNTLSIMSASASQRAGGSAKKPTVRAGSGTVGLSSLEEAKRKSWRKALESCGLDPAMVDDEAHGEDPITSVISTLEEELRGLNDRYRRLVELGRDCNASHEFDDINKEMRDTIERMEQKGEQIEKLRQHNSHHSKLHEQAKYLQLQRATRAQLLNDPRIKAMKSIARTGLRNQAWV